MKTVSEFRLFICLVAIMLSASSLFAQDSAFTAKAGMAAARQAVDDAGYTDAYLVAVHTPWPYQKEELFIINEIEEQRYWNGLAYNWTYTFFQRTDSSFYAFKVLLLPDSTFVTSVASSSVYLDTSRIKDGWMDSDDFANIMMKQNPDTWTTVINMSFTSDVDDGNYAYNKFSWRAESPQNQGVFVEAYTGEILNSYIVGIESNQKNADLQIYPNPSSSNFTVQLNNFNYTSIDILGLYGEILTSLKIPEGSDNFTIPIENFPSSGQYFLRLKSRGNTQIIPVTIIR